MQGFMRTGQTSRPYGRYNGNNADRNRQQIPHRSQNCESNGPNIKIRGTPHQIFERYIALAREASTSGDRVASENLYQHAEHYFRVMNAANEGLQHRAPRPTAADLQTQMSQEEGSEMVGPNALAAPQPNRVPWLQPEPSIASPTAGRNAGVVTRARRAAARASHGEPLTGPD